MTHHDSPQLPQRREAGMGAESGRGLEMVELLGGMLAVWRLDVGKLVRLRISRQTPDLAAAAGWIVDGDA